MELTFDVYQILLLFDRFGNQSPLGSIWQVFIKGGWIIFLWFFIQSSYIFWLLRKQNQWFATHRYIILAIDIPKDTEQTPKAVEQLFSTISGAHTPLSWK